MVDWDALGALGDTVVYGPGEVIIGRDAKGTFAVLEHGVVVERETVNGVSEARDFIAARSVVSDGFSMGAERCGVEYIASTEVSCVILTRGVLHTLPGELMFDLAEVMIRRVGRPKSASNAAALGRSAPLVLRSFLVELYSMFANAGDSEHIIIPHPVADVATCVGVDLGWTQHALAEMGRKDVVTVHPTSIALLDLDGLRNFAEMRPRPYVA